MKAKKRLAVAVCILLATLWVLPARAIDPPIDAKRDLQGINPKRHRYLFSVLGGAAIGAGVGVLVGSGGDIVKGILVGGGGASTAWLHTHPHDPSRLRSFQFLASHTALGTGLGWTVCGCSDGGVAGGLVGFGASSIWQASEPRRPTVAKKSKQEEEQMRARLIQQLNHALPTEDTSRGVVVSMPDVLFDSNKSVLTPAARERLAKVAGVLMAYPDLRLQVEGFTDNTGTPQRNAELSNERARNVRDFLVLQGVASKNVEATGYGANQPVASNDTPEGRLRNRRVDVVLSGPTIGYAKLPPGMAPGSSGGATGAAAQKGTEGSQSDQTAPGSVAAPPPQKTE